MVQKLSPPKVDSLSSARPSASLRLLKKCIYFNDRISGILGIFNSLLFKDGWCCENCTKLEVRDKSTSLVFFCAARNHMPAVCSLLNDLTKLILGMVPKPGKRRKTFSFQGKQKIDDTQGFQSQKRSISAQFVHCFRFSKKFRIPIPSKVNQRNKKCTTQLQSFEKIRIQ